MVSSKEKIFFAEHLSLMTKGGIPVNEAIETLRDETKSRVFKKALDDILKKILEGQRLSKILESHPRIFDKFFCNVVKVGEESGTLEENLKYLAQQLKSDYEMKRKVSGALIYPAIVITALFAVAAIVLIFVIPQLTEMYDDFGAELPFVTQLLIDTSDLFVAYWWILLALFGIGGFALRSWLKTESGQRSFSKFVLKIPLYGALRQKIIMTEFARTLSLLLTAGIS